MLTSQCQQQFGAAAGIASSPTGVKLNKSRFIYNSIHHIVEYSVLHLRALHNNTRAHWTRTHNRLCFSKTAPHVYIGGLNWFTESSVEPHRWAGRSRATLLPPDQLLARFLVKEFLPRRQQLIQALIPWALNALLTTALDALAASVTQSVCVCVRACTLLH